MLVPIIGLFTVVVVVAGFAQLRKMRVAQRRALEGYAREQSELIRRQEAANAELASVRITADDLAVRGVDEVISNDLLISVWEVEGVFYVKAWARSSGNFPDMHAVVDRKDGTMLDESISDGHARFSITQTEVKLLSFVDDEGLQRLLKEHSEEPVPI